MECMELPWDAPAPPAQAQQQVEAHLDTAMYALSGRLLIPCHSGAGQTSLMKQPSWAAALGCASTSCTAATHEAACKTAAGVQARLQKICDQMFGHARQGILGEAAQLSWDAPAPPVQQQHLKLQADQLMECRHCGSQLELSRKLMWLGSADSVAPSPPARLHWPSNRMVGNSKQDLRHSSAGMLAQPQLLPSWDRASCSSSRFDSKPGTPEHPRHQKDPLNPFQALTYSTAGTHGKQRRVGCPLSLADSRTFWWKSSSSRLMT